jgi:septum site-determining protein MinC
VEGVAAEWLPERLAPLPGVLQPVGMFAPKEESPRLQTEPPQFNSAQPAADRISKCATLLIDEPVRSGQIISYLEGDVTVVGSVASGAEIIAGGSIHVYGALRGRAYAGAAYAGTNSHSGARIFCSKFDAEILVIDGLYRTADDFDQALRGTPVQARLDHGIMNIKTVN